MADRFNLDTMPLEELRDLRSQVDRAISGFTERKRREAMAAAEEAVRAHGFSSLSDVTRQRRGAGRNPAASGRAAGGSRPVGEPRFANPDDASQTWSGRGRRPQWVKDQIEGGRSLDDMSI